jgi:hypothetical protein
LKAASEGRISKFVPASGAASRMFKNLVSFNTKYKKIDISDIKKKADQGSAEHQDLLIFLTKISEFAFYDDLKQCLLKQGLHIENLIEEGEFKNIVNAVISEDGLNYANLPKGLIKFHKYPNYNRTAFEEHLVEAAEYCKDNRGVSRIHFTISKEHEFIVKDFLKDLTPQYGVNDLSLDITFSLQKLSSYSIAVDLNNEPFRLANGRLLFRPGGHGALLENLSELNNDIVIIKNIDNVVPDRLRKETYKYKKILCGYLVELQARIFNYLWALNSQGINNQIIDEIVTFTRNELYAEIPADFKSLPETGQKDWLFSVLNRPIRVCGMVRNVGEPGGGPFWVENSDGTQSLQVVEAAQLQKDSPEQMEIWNSATHFSPTDFICGVRDFNGNLFNLLDYRDPDTAFIVAKSQDGRDLKSIELPGLWNGSMALWNTIFVEVPIITFNPVKTILDLLRKEHLPLK